MSLVQFNMLVVDLLLPPEGNHWPGCWADQALGSPPPFNCLILSSLKKNFSCFLHLIVCTTTSSFYQLSKLILILIITLKGIVHQIFFYRSNLIFWILMGCGNLPLVRLILVEISYTTPHYYPKYEIFWVNNPFKSAHHHVQRKPTPSAVTQTVSGRGSPEARQSKTAPVLQSIFRCATRKRQK